jgi:hypothetical protein
MVLIRTRRMIVIRALVASVVGVGAGGLSAGCGNDLKSDGQIQASPEASNAAAAVAKSYGEQMTKKYAGQMKNRKQ